MLTQHLGVCVNSMTSAAYGSGVNMNFPLFAKMPALKENFVAFLNKRDPSYVAPEDQAKLFVEDGVVNTRLPPRRHHDPKEPKFNRHAMVHLQDFLRENDRFYDFEQLLKEHKQAGQWLLREFRTHKLDLPRCKHDRNRLVFSKCASGGAARSSEEPPPKKSKVAASRVVTASRVVAPEKCPAHKAGGRKKQVPDDALSGPEPGEEASSGADPEDEDSSGSDLEDPPQGRPFRGPGPGARMVPRNRLSTLADVAADSMSEQSWSPSQAGSAPSGPQASSGGTPRSKAPVGQARSKAPVIQARSNAPIGQEARAEAQSRANAAGEVMKLYSPEYDTAVLSKPCEVAIEISRDAAGKVIGIRTRLAIELTKQVELEAAQADPNIVLWSDFVAGQADEFEGYKNLFRHNVGGLHLSCIPFEGQRICAPLQSLNPALHNMAISVQVLDKRIDIIEPTLQMLTSMDANPLKLDMEGVATLFQQFTSNEHLRVFFRTRDAKREIDARIKAVEDYLKPCPMIHTLERAAEFMKKCNEIKNLVEARAVPDDHFKRLVETTKTETMRHFPHEMTDQQIADIFAVIDVATQSIGFPPYEFISYIKRRDGAKEAAEKLLNFEAARAFEASTGKTIRVHLADFPGIWDKYKLAYKAFRSAMDYTDATHDRVQQLETRVKEMEMEIQSLRSQLPDPAPAGDGAGAVTGSQLPDPAPAGDGAGAVTGSQLPDPAPAGDGAGAVTGSQLPDPAPAGDGAGAVTGSQPPDPAPAGDGAGSTIRPTRARNPVDRLDPSTHTGFGLGVSPKPKDTPKSSRNPSPTR